MVVRARGGGTPGKQGLQTPQDRCTYELPDTVVACKDLHRVKPGGVPALRGGGRHRLLPLAKKLFAADTSGQRQNQFSPSEDHWVYQPHSKAGPMSWSNRPIQTKLQAFLQAFFHFDLFGLFFFLSPPPPHPRLTGFFYLIFFFFGRERRNAKLGGEGGGEDLGRVGGRKTGSKNSVYNF